MRTLLYLLMAAPLLAFCAPHDGKRNENQDGIHKRQGYGAPSPSSSSAPPPSSTSCVPMTTPTKAYTVKASNPGTPIDELPMNAGGRSFRLGGTTSAYCPISVGELCPPGNETVFTFGTISVLVPGGQQQYVEASGRLGYTQAHSISTPIGSLPSGFGYSKCPDEEYGHIIMTTFGADGLMACPDSGSSSSETTYVVFAKIPDAVVPSGNVEDCIDFDGLTSDYDGPIPAAWQY